jgi:hypothetical protein
LRRGTFTFFLPLLAGHGAKRIWYPLALAKRVSDPLLAKPIRKKQKKSRALPRKLNFAKHQTEPVERPKPLGNPRQPE